MAKKITNIITIMLILIVGISSSFALDTIGPNIQIVKNEVNPEPVEPGNDLTLKVMITNSGDELANNVNIIPQIDSPFYFKKSDLNKQNFAICGGCSYDATYYLSVNSDTISGIYPINFNIEYENDLTKKETIFVKVIGVPDIIIDYNNENIEFPDENFELKLNLKNIGTGNARNIKITSLSEDFLLKGSQTKIIDELKANNKNELTLYFQSNSELESKLYKIPFKISYLDEQGILITKESEVSINIKDSSEIDIQNLKIENAEVKIFDDLIISGIIENTGSGKAENVYAYLETDLEGYNKSFIGSLKPDEDSPIIFKLKSAKSGDFPIKLIIHYEDDKGIHSIEENIMIKVTKPLNTVYTVVGVLVLIIGIFSAKHFLKKKEK